MFEEVKDKLKSLGISPIFFIGSGLSKRYIDSPNWIGLLEESVKDTDINFIKYRQKYTTRNQSTNEDEIDLELLAQELEEQYFDSIPDEKIEDGRSKAYYYRKKIAEVISSYLEKGKDNLYINKEVIELKKTYPSAIITTNYDEMLEEIFDDEYTVHIGQTSLLTNVLDGVGEIYKIHGCVTECDSIVITKNDYDMFSKKELYLNAKILTLFLEYPIVFLGYSVSDRNVKSILTTIFNILPYDKVEELKSRMWFITRPKDGIDKQILKRINLEGGQYIDINSYELNHYDDFYKVISDISIKKLPIRFLKYLKNNTYKLVASQEYNPKLLNVNVSEIEKIKNFNEGNNFVGLTFSTTEKKIFSSSSEIIDVFIEGDGFYEGISVLGVANEIYSSNKCIPIYKFIEHLNIDDILNEVIKRFGKNSRIYKRITKDNIDYKHKIGQQKKKMNYNGKLSESEVEAYLEKYKEYNEYGNNQIAVIKKYFMLYLLNNRLDELIENKDYVNENKQYITQAATHLSEEYIRKQHENVVMLVKILYNDNDTGEFKKFICLIDRAIYRNQIQGIN